MLIRGQPSRTAPAVKDFLFFYCRCCVPATFCNLSRPPRLSKTFLLFFPPSKSRTHKELDAENSRSRILCKCFFNFFSPTSRASDRLGMKPPKSSRKAAQPAFQPSEPSPTDRTSVRPDKGSCCEAQGQRISVLGRPSLRSWCHRNAGLSVARAIETQAP